MGAFLVSDSMGASSKCKLSGPLAVGGTVGGASGRSTLTTVLVPVAFSRLARNATGAR
jgi:hypothetical protein